MAVALPSGLHYGNAPSLTRYRLIGIVMDESYRMLLIAICACLLAIAIPALIGLVVAWRLDKKNELGSSDDSPS